MLKQLAIEAAKELGKLVLERVAARIRERRRPPSPAEIRGAFREAARKIRRKSR